MALRMVDGPCSPTLAAALSLVVAAVSVFKVETAVASPKFAITRAANFSSGDDGLAFTVFAVALLLRLFNV